MFFFTLIETDVLADHLNNLLIHITAHFFFNHSSADKNLVDNYF